MYFWAGFGFFGAFAGVIEEAEGLLNRSMRLAFSCINWREIRIIGL